MNDILLTPDAAFEARQVAYMEFMAKSDSERKSMSTEVYYKALQVSGNQAICRAQLRKAVEWMEKHNEANTSKFFQGDLIMNDDDWAALKAAGGGSERTM